MVWLVVVLTEAWDNCIEGTQCKYADLGFSLYLVLFLQVNYVQILNNRILFITKHKLFQFN